VPKIRVKEGFIEVNDILGSMYGKNQGKELIWNLETMVKVGFFDVSGIHRGYIEWYRVPNQYRLQNPGSEWVFSRVFNIPGKYIE
jgi:hypothetical protein